MCTGCQPDCDLRIDRLEKGFSTRTPREQNYIAFPYPRPLGEELPEGALRMPDRLISNDFDHAGCIQRKLVLPEFSSLADYVGWAEECAARHGIKPPYKRSDFDPASVYSRMLSHVHVPVVSDSV